MIILDEKVEKMKREQLIKRSIGIILAVLIVMMTASEFLVTTNKFQAENVNEITEWTYEGVSVEPGDLNLPANQPYPLVNNTLKGPTTLLIRTGLSDVKVYLDGQQVYEYTYESEGQLKKPRASLWHFVELSHGGVLTVTYQTPYEKISGRMNPIMYGEKSDLILYVFQVYGGPFIIDGMIMFLGVIMLLIAFLYPKSIYKNIFNIGLFAITIGSWLISESKMLQFFTGSEWFIGSLAFISLTIIPIPFLLYFKSVVDKKHHTLIYALLAGSAINLITVVGLQVFNILDFYNTVHWSHTYLVFIMGCIFIMMTIELKTQNKEIWHLLFSLGILFAFIGVEMMRFYIFDAVNVTFFIRIGILIFITMMSTNAGRQIIKRISKSNQAEFYEKLAFSDQLTGAPNRSAFDRDFEVIFADEEIKDNLTLFIMDLNNLKSINDLHGHVTGDTAIKEAYQLIHNHFKSIGRTYRIGGDEFASLVEANELDIRLAEEALREHVNEFAIRQTYDFGIAIGRVKYENDLSMISMMHRADIHMYEDKKIVSKIN